MPITRWQTLQAGNRITRQLKGKFDKFLTAGDKIASALYASAGALAILIGGGLAVF
jgi:hypothetical protein